MTTVPKTQTDLREMVYHTDARVTAMEGQVNTLVLSHNRTEGKIDQLISNLNQPKHVNWAAWVGVALTFMAMSIGGLYGISQYITLTQAPIIEEVAYQRDITQTIRGFQRETHYEVGVQHTKNEWYKLEIERLWEHIHKQEEVDSDLRDRVARAEVSRKAIGDYVRQIDELGSRRWMNDNSKRASRVDDTD